MVAIYNPYILTVVAAVLHDTIEDTRMTPVNMFDNFGMRVTMLVLEVTHVAKLEDGNRKIRKAIDRDWLARASGSGQTIKYADIINNAGSILKRDPKFAKFYIPECRALLDVMDKGNPILRRLAYKSLEGK